MANKKKPIIDRKQILIDSYRYRVHNFIKTYRTAFGIDNGLCGILTKDANDDIQSNDIDNNIDELILGIPYLKISTSIVTTRESGVYKVYTRINRVEVNIDELNFLKETDLNMVHIDFSNFINKFTHSNNETDLKFIDHMKYSYITKLRDYKDTLEYDTEKDSESNDQLYDIAKIPVVPGVSFINNISCLLASVPEKYSLKEKSKICSTSFIIEEEEILKSNNETQLKEAYMLLDDYIISLEDY